MFFFEGVITTINDLIFLGFFKWNDHLLTAARFEGMISHDFRRLPSDSAPTKIHPGVSNTTIRHANDG